METAVQEPILPKLLPKTNPSVSNNGENESTCRKIVNALKQDWVLLLTAVGIVIGFIIGLAIRPAEPSKNVLLWIGMPGEIFLRLLKLIIIPLIAASIISGTASSDPKSNGKTSGIAFAYINITNVMGAIIGLVLGVIFKPGESVSDSDEITQVTSALDTHDIISDLIRNIFPDNMFRATIQKSQTTYEEILVNGTVTDLVKSVTYVDSPNILGVIFISIVFGIATGFARGKGKPFLLFFTSLTDIIMIVMNWFMWTSPIGICSLIASTLGGIKDLRKTFIRLGALIGTHVGGCVFHQFILLPIIILILTRRNPLPVMAKAIKPWIVAITAGLTVVSTPAVFEATERMGLDARVSAVAVPLAVTLNRDGSCIFIALVVLFLAQINQVTLGGGQYVLIIFLTWISGLAIPSVPSSSLVAIIIICTTLSLSFDTIGLLFAVEWFQDRVRTAGNVLSVTVCAYVTNHLVRGDMVKKNEIEDEDMKLDKFEDGECTL